MLIVVGWRLSAWIEEERAARAVPSREVAEMLVEMALKLDELEQ